MRTISKQKPSRFDHFSEQLLKMDDAKKSLAEMEKWLKQQGISAASSSISYHLKKLRDQRLKRQLFENIVSGSHLGQDAEDAFKKNPAPALNTVVKVFKVLIMQLTTKGAADPDTLKLADSLAKTALQFVNSQTMERLKEREVALAEQRAADAKKDEQTQALEFCLDEAKKFPEVRKMYRAAFAALKAAKARTGQTTT